MKKTLFTIISLLMVLALCSCSLNSGYKITCVSSMPPFYSQNKDGEYEGIDVDIMELIGAATEMEYSVEHGDKKLALETLLTENTDAVYGNITPNPDIADTYDFSEPYYTEGVAVCVRKDNEDITSFETLKGKKLSVLADSNCYYYAKELSKEYDFSLVTYNDYSAMYNDTITEKVTDGLIEELTVAKEAMASGVPLKIACSDEDAFEYVFAFAKGKNEQLKQLINSAITNGAADEIKEKYNK